MIIKETTTRQTKDWGCWEHDPSIKIDPQLVRARADHKEKHGSFELLEFQFGIVEEDGQKHYLITSKFGPVCANNPNKESVEALLESLINDPRNRSAIFTLWEYPAKVISLVKHNQK
jgi:hypothetical protein